MNIQPIEKLVPNRNGFFEVHSIFKTIQGEGPFCGTPAIFIRLAGCNLQCPQCDTDYTSKRQTMSVWDLLAACTAYDGQNPGLVVITGGEPFRQHIGQLIGILVGYGFYVQIETNGTLPPPPEVVWSKQTHQRKGAYIVCSPKAGRINTITEREACCFKYMMSHDSVGSDGLPVHVLGHGAHPTVARAVFRGRPIYLQPADAHDIGENKLNNQAVVESCLKFGYNLQLQIHKFLGVE